MAKRSLMLTFPENLITEPLIYDMGKQFNVSTNILRAKVERDQGWVVLQLEGDDAKIDRAVAWARDKGVCVESVSADVPR